MSRPKLAALGSTLVVVLGTATAPAGAGLAAGPGWNARRFNANVDTSGKLRLR